MKITQYLLLFLIACSFIMCKKVKHPKNIFILKGSFTGKAADTIFLTYRDSSGNRIEKSTAIIKGHFSFWDSINYPVHADLTSNIKTYPGSNDTVSNFAEVFLTPGEMTIELRENDFDHAKITGSPTQDEWNNLLKSYEPVNKIRDSLYDKMFGLERAGNTPKNHLAHEAIVRELDKYQLEIDKIDYNYIIGHPKSYLSAYLLENFLGTDIRSDSIELFYKPFSDSVKKSMSGKIIEKEILNRKESAVGSIVKMPSGTNADGSRFDPRTIKINNYLLLYFWASQANNNSRLKPVYDKYHTRGLDILAISIDEPKRMWIDSIKNDHISMWHNISSDPVDNLDTFYNIKQMAPSLLLLVDKNHRIVGRYRGDGVKWYKFDYREGNLNDLEKKLAEIFEKN
ncbi:MAG TPA: DUF4369 domain-containing protein [Mucilaginibacter sp.]|nr:DUF4369 domain-containing protein [Mucilaginibacter sp.]